MRMKYKPYKAGEVIVSSTIEENIDNGMKFTENDMKYINKIVELQKAKWITVLNPLPVFNSLEEAKGKFGILVIDQNGVKSRTVANFDQTGSTTRPDYTIMESWARLYRGEDVSQDEKHQ